MRSESRRTPCGVLRSSSNIILLPASKVAYVSLAQLPMRLIKDNCMRHKLPGEVEVPALGKYIKAFLVKIVTIASL